MEDFLNDIGEGAFHADEEDRRLDREPYPDEVWDRELDEEEVIP